MKLFLTWLLLLIALLTMPVGMAESPENAWISSEPGAQVGGASIDRAAESGQLRVHFLSLGRVDAILLECDGETAFVDVGYRSGAAKAIRYMKALGIEKLTYYIGTHAHRDHVGGAPAIIEAMKPDKVLVSHDGCKRAILSYAENNAEEKAAKNADYDVLKPGDARSLGGAELLCIGPKDTKVTYFDQTSENNNSLILRVGYGTRSFLLTADTTDGILQGLEKRGPGILACDVFKNPHHNASHDAALFKLVNPSYVVFTTSGDEPPARDFVNALRKRNIRLFSAASDDAGNIIFTTDGTSLSVHCARDVTSVTIRETEITVKPGKRVSLHIGARPKRAIARPMIVSDDPAIAKVDVSGGVIGVAPGETTVRVRGDDGLAEATVRVTVAP